MNKLYNNKIRNNKLYITFIEFLMKSSSLYFLKYSIYNKHSRIPINIKHDNVIMVIIIYLFLDIIHCKKKINQLSDVIYIIKTNKYVSGYCFFECR